MKAKVIKSIFMTLISVLFVTLCVTFAWFYAIRSRNVSENGFSAVQLDAKLYYCNYNVNEIPEDHKLPYKFNGYEDTRVLDFTPSLDKHLLSDDATAIDNNKSYFTRFSPTVINPYPFIMQDVVPGKRFMFIVKCKHNFETAINAKLNLIDWLSDYTSDNNGHTIYFSEAIYFYTLGCYLIDPLSHDQNVCKTTDQAAEIIANYSNDNLKTDASGYSKNKFQLNHEKIKSESNENLDSKGKPIPLVLESFNLLPEKEYLIPFIIEYTNDPASYYSYNELLGYKKDPQFGNSNCYDALSMTNIDLCLKGGI